MTWRHLYGRAEVDTRNPQPFAICDRCGIQYNQEDLVWQVDIRGTQLQNIRLLVCRFCKDNPAIFTVPLILPADPLPVFNSRAEPYAIDETDFRVTEEEDQRITQEGDNRVIDESANEDLSGADFTGS